MIGFWFALEDATLENGCLWAAAGRPPGPLRSLLQASGHGGGTEFEELDPTPLPVPPDELVPLPVPAGTMVVLDGRLPHWSDANRSAPQPPRVLAALHLRRRGLPGVELVAAAAPTSRCRPLAGRPVALRPRRPRMIDPGPLRRAPKVVLHDHLDGGLRPATVVELAREYGYAGLPTTDVDDLARWFHRGAKRNDLVLYLETFAHTVGVMQDRDAIVRVAAECAEDLAADGVVYAEVRFAPEQHIEAGLTLDEVVDAVLEGFRLGSAGTNLTIYAICSAMRTAARSLEIAELAVRWRDAGVVGLRHRRRRGRLPADPPPRRLPARAAGELPHHHPRRRGLRPAVDLGGRAVVRGRAARPRRAHRRRHRRSIDGEHHLGRLAAYVRDRRIPLEMCPTSNVNTGVVAVIADHPIGLLRPAALPGDGQHRQPADERHVDEPRAAPAARGASARAGTTSSG